MAKIYRPSKGKLRGLFRFTLREFGLIVAGGLGLFFGLPNPLIQLPLLILLFPFAISCLALEAESEGRAIACTLGVTMLGGGLAVHWLVYPMINYGGVPLPLAILFMLLLVAVLSLYYIVYSLLLRFYRDNLPGPLLLLAAAITWGGLEYARGWIFTGVTWCDISTAMIGWPIFAQGASILGIYGLSSLYALAALCFVPLFLREQVRKYLWNGLPQAALGLAIIAGLAFFGWQRVDQDFTQGEPVILAQAQGNIDQAQKWQASMQAATVRHYLRLSIQAINKSIEEFGKMPDLLVWPETAMPFYFQNDVEMARPIREFVRASEVPLLFGLPARSMHLGAEESFNRVCLLDENGLDAGCYDKEHLVPFGEYVPKGLYVPFASEFLQGHGFTAGTAEKPLGYKDFQLGVLICYEAIFPELAQARVSSGANLLVNVSNDAWFADSPAPWQHLQLSAMRAVEQGRYLIRSTNTGVSALIDPAGRILGHGPLFEDFVSAHQAYLLEDRTFFNRHYEAIHAVQAWLPFLFIALAASSGLFRRIIKR